MFLDSNDNRSVADAQVTILPGNAILENGGALRVVAPADGGTVLVRAFGEWRRGALDAERALVGPTTRQRESMERRIGLPNWDLGEHEERRTRGDQHRRLDRGALGDGAGDVAEDLAGLERADREPGLALRVAAVEQPGAGQAVHRGHERHEVPVAVEVVVQPDRGASAAEQRDVRDQVLVPEWAQRGVRAGRVEPGRDTKVGLPELEPVLEDPRSAVEQRAVAAAEVRERRDRHVEVAVVVDVHPRDRAARRVLSAQDRGGQAAGGGDVDELAAPVVEQGQRISAQQHIRVAVSVVVRDGRVAAPDAVECGGGLKVVLQRAGLVAADVDRHAVGLVAASDDIEVTVGVQVEGGRAHQALSAVLALEEGGPLAGGGRHDERRARRALVVGQQQVLAAIRGEVGGHRRRDPADGPKPVR